MSNVIKSSAYIPLNDRKLIEVLQQRYAASGQQVSLPGDADGEMRAGEAETAATLTLAAEEAEKQAQELLRTAREEAERIRSEAREEAAAWWNEQRERGDAAIEEARGNGYEEGMRQGLEEGRRTAAEEAAGMLEDAKAALERAYRVKEQIIAEAEPFLVELSLGIAQRIVERDLSGHQEWTRELVRKTLSQRQMKGTITVCVSPAHFQYVHDARDELALAIDAEADLVVLQDASVKDEGCVIRTPLGSIDARIDTQLKEIKAALLEAARESGADADD